MFVLQLAEILFKAGILCLLLYLMARHEADYSFTKVAMVTAGITLGNLLMEVFLMHYIGWLTIIPIAGFVIFMLMQFCWIPFKKAVLVTVPFLAVCILLTMGMTVLQKRANAALGNSLSTRPGDQEEMQEIMKFYQQHVGSFSSSTNSSTEDMEALATPPPSPLKAATKITALQTILSPVLPNSETGVNWLSAQTKLNTSGIMTGKKGNTIAVVNNRMVKVGDRVQVKYNHHLYQWLVLSIRHDNVTWKQLSVEPID